MTSVVALGSLPSALNVAEAVKQVHRLKSIGYCPSKVAELRKHLELGDGPLSEEVLYVSPTVSEEQREREEHNTAAVAKFAAMHPEYGQNSASGYLDKPFSLHITRQGCEFDSSIIPPSKFYNYRNEPQFSEAEIEQTKTRLQAWYDNAKVSDYGHVQDQVTKIDASAREIPASEFTVKPELLDEIANLWDTHFYSNQGVRVEPYKIHLYGPGGQFNVHRNTPQKDLVGTFLLGLGDSSMSRGLYVDGEDMPAHEAHWCAFYLSVPHCVDKVSQGHRAVIAFKIFRDTSGTGGRSKASSKVEEQVAELVGSMKAPFGIMLARKYCLGTSVLSEFDNLLLTAMRSLETVDVKHIPVVLTSFSEWGLENDPDMCFTAAFPFTTGHIDALVQRSELGSYQVPLDHTSCGCPWLYGVEDVPFFAFYFKRSVYAYSENGSANNVGDLAPGWREESVYLSYALLALPKHP
ncbi:hypothetical protein C8Q74DRAFT_1252680 [Fomes fomentarius]|nr:hypothetical protein C8Q74DRAFT_1252680 [Fomes fomentarius]